MLVKGGENIMRGLSESEKRILDLLETQDVGVEDRIATIKVLREKVWDRAEEDCWRYLR